jgi:predicted HAD superfamily Cof-like phosphohydrolase
MEGVGMDKQEIEVAVGRPPHPRQKSSHQVAVETLMENAGQVLRSEPEVPTLQERILRVRLTIEEALEFAEASGVGIIAEPRGNGYWLRFDDLRFAEHGDPDLAEMADACADVSVVNTGALSAMGIADLSLLHEVDSNNLLKFVELGPCETCGGTGQEVAYSGSTVTPCGVCHGRKTLGGYRDEHGKWIKPVNHPKPNIARVLHDQGRSRDPEEVKA